MRNQGLILFGAVLIIFGLIFLIGTVFDVDVGALCWPSLLILVGVWMLLRPRLLGPDALLRMRFFGPIRRRGVWQVADEEMWLFIGDVHLDFTAAEIPLGETQVRLGGFIGNIRLLVPEDVGIAVSSMAFVSDVRVLGQRRDGVLTPVHMTSDGYETAERKVRLELTFFIADVRTRQA